MGISASKRVQKALNSSHEFNSACNSVYAEFLSLAQHAFAGVKPYQLLSATVHLHRTLSHSLPIISKWVPRCPDRVHVDRALKTVLSHRSEAAPPPEEITLGESEFKEFALEVFRDAVVSNAGREVLKKVPLGVAGIAGVGVVAKPGKEVVAAAIGAYALAVATSIYLSLDV